MMTAVKLLVITTFVFIMVSCSNTTEKSDNPQNESQVETPIDKSERSPQIQLFTDVESVEMPPEKVIEINGKEYPSKLVQLKLSEFGFYVPEILEVYTFEDGARIGQNKGAEYIAVREVSSLRNPDNIPGSLGSADAAELQDEVLSEYKEYVGSNKDENGVRTDAFLIQHSKAVDHVVYFRYFENNKDSVLPVFLEIAKHIKYMGRE